MLKKESRIYAGSGVSQTPIPDKGERRVIEEDNQLYDREKEEKIKELKEEYQKALEKQ